MTRHRSYFLSVFLFVGALYSGNSFAVCVDECPNQTAPDVEATIGDHACHCPAPIGWVAAANQAACEGLATDCRWVTLTNMNAGLYACEMAADGLPACAGSCDDPQKVCKGISQNCALTYNPAHTKVTAHVTLTCGCEIPAEASEFRYNYFYF